MDLNQLNGAQLAILERAILSAFTKPELDRLLSHGDREAIDTLVPSGPFGQQVSELLRDARRKGWTDWLLSALLLERPNNPRISNLLNDLEAAAQSQVGSASASVVRRREVGAQPGPSTRTEEHTTSLRPNPRNLPFASLGDLFKGREGEFDALYRALNDPSTRGAAVTGRALHGLGGVGKTRLAVEYAHRHADEYSALVFLSAETPERLDAGLAALAGPDMFNLPEKDAREDEVKIPATLGWLDRNPGWLMILDNIDDKAALKAVQALLAKLSNGKVIITGRLATYPAAMKKLELGVLSAEAAKAFLMERTASDRVVSPDDEAQAKKLAEELGGLALGLEQAGAYIAAERTSFADYLKLWQGNRGKIIGWFDKELMSYAHDSGLAATWATSVERLTPEARQLLERLAFLAPEPVPDTLLDVRVKGEAEGYDPQAARRELFAFSLATRVTSQAATTIGFTVHRLVQDFAFRNMDTARQHAALEEALGWVAAAFVGDPADIRTWALLDPLAPHALAVAGRGHAEGISLPTSSLYSRLGLLFHAKARYVDAERMSRAALAIDEASLGPDDSSVATRLNNLAVSLVAMNRAAEAESLYRRALTIHEGTYGAHHPSVATSLNNLAILLRTTNRAAEAEPFYRRALAIREASYGAHHPEVATSLNNLAALLHMTNRTGEAEPLFRRALAIDEMSYGADHPRVAVRLNNLAMLLRAADRFTEAESLYRRALMIHEASYGPHHPSVATGLNNLASVLSDLNRAAESEPLYRRALAIDEASYGPDHPEVAADLNNLAELLHDTNRTAEAEPLYRRAFAIYEASLGPGDPRTDRVRANLATLLGE